MELYLVRHAESENNALPTYQRVPDPDLTAVGRLQAQHLSHWLTSLKWDHFITSPFRRTIKTTLPVMQYNAGKVEIWHEVFERGGCFSGYHEGNFAGQPGMGRSELVRLLGREAERCLIAESIDEAGWWNQPHRESDQEAWQRALQINQKLVQRYQRNEVVVMLIHADLKRLMLADMLQQRCDVIGLGALRNCGITKVNYQQQQWQLDYFNSVTHMPAKLITGNEH